ncbi:hypothetical protein [Cupriavidus necator]|uniref:hypothetical protein n=1 Tax=Cupriavidus necator TaxID=106590 RepID=UPI0012FF6F94|nr:hypothetical protein [Cupriavidus necator]QQB81340.1 hypothetical protein I6H87_33650 [Cupriavidus necator]
MKALLVEMRHNDWLPLHKSPRDSLPVTPDRGTTGIAARKRRSLRIRGPEQPSRVSRIEISQNHWQREKKKAPALPGLGGPKSDYFHAKHRHGASFALGLNNYDLVMQ